MKTETIARLVELLHANTFTEDNFVAVLDELRRVTNSRLAAMVESCRDNSTPPELSISGGNKNTAQLAGICDYLLTVCPSHHWVKLSRAVRVFQLCTVDDCRMFDAGYICGVLIETTQSNIVLLVSRAAEQTGYSPAEEDVLKQLAPQLEVALENRHRLSFLKNRMANLTQALELSELAVGIIGASGKLLFCSSPFYDCLLKNNLLASSSMGRLQLRSYRHNGWLKTTIQRVSYSQNYQPQILRLSVTPLVELQLTMLKQVNGAPVFLLHLKTMTTHSQWWRLVYHFTPKELLLIDKLLSGLTLPEAAEELQVSHNTVRTHLHNILVKTKCNSQNQLLVTLLSPH